MTNRVYRSGANLASVGRIPAVKKGLEAGRGRKEQSLWNRYCPAFLPFVLGLAPVLGIAGCSANATKTEGASATPLISVAIAQAPPATLTVGSSAPVSATVTNDLANAGVDWVAMCASAPKCGSFSPPHTASGATTVFTTPLGVPAHNTVTVTALSATDHSKASAASLTIISTVTGITLTQPPPLQFASGGTLTMAATVTGDPANLGVDWRATCGVVDCTSGFIGTHSPAATPIQFVVPLTSVMFPDIVGSTVTITAFPTADHSFSASASFVVTGSIGISITQAPPSTLLTNASAPLIAVVNADPTNAGVTWTILSCDAAPCGSWSSASVLLSTQADSGATVTYTAPPTAVGHVFIQAAATAAPNATATVTLSVTAPVSIAITKKIVNDTIVQNASAPLIATVSNDPLNQGVDWKATCGSAACGTFSPAHTDSGSATTFTAPAVPTGNTVTITATATADKTGNTNATETVTVTSTKPPNSLLPAQTQFVILLTAKNSSNGPYALGGVIKGDGTGGITTGSLDLADASGNTSPASIIPYSQVAPAGTTSSYSIGPDGRGQIDLFIDTTLLNAGAGGSFGVNGSGELILSVVFVTPQHALLSETDTFGSATGTLDQQNLQGFALNGSYSLRLSGFDKTRRNGNYFPSYFLTSALTIPGGNYSYITDQSDAGVITSIPFTTAAQPFAVNGPGASGELLLSSPLNLGTIPLHLDLWVIDATHLVVTDWRDAAVGTPKVIISGYFTAQPAAPAIAGTYAFTEAGETTAAQPQVAGGIFTCGSTGTLDVVPLAGVGTPLTAQPINVPNCFTPVNGRGLITITGAGSTGIAQFAAYPTLDQGLYLIELDGGPAGTSGPSGACVALQQTVPLPATAAAFSGKYASNFLASTTLGSQNFAGQIISNGASILSGTADVNSFDTTAAPPAGTPSSGATLSGTFTADPTGNGRFPLVLTFAPAAGQPPPQVPTINPACYIIDANTCLLLGLDAAAPGTGILQLQNTGL